MKTISYKGAVYVEAAHKKCENGTHWNDKERKCMKLVGDLKTQSEYAMSLTPGANKASKAANDPTSHKHARELHNQAQINHADARDRLGVRGFRELSNKHNKLWGHHYDKVNEHRKAMET